MYSIIVWNFEYYRAAASESSVIAHQISIISAWECLTTLRLVITAVITRVMTLMTSHLRVMT
jgi:hypothetical protein